MAQDYQALVGVEFLMGPGGDVAHGHVYAAFDVGGGEFPRLADVDEFGFALGDERGGFGWGDFEFEHDSSL